MIINKRERINTLLQFHTTLASWGVPCITSLAFLMNAPIPRTSKEKSLLIKRAQEYIKGGQRKKRKK